MNIKSVLKKFIRNRGGYVFGPGTVPKGVDLFHDLRRFGYASHIKTVFDVGANVGQFARAASACLPQARLFSYEPVKSTFEILRQNLAPLPKAQAYRSAMGSSKGELRMTSKPGSVMNHVLGSGNLPEKDELVELVPVNTVANAAKDLSVEQIDLLKTDTEGFDLEVLQGATELLHSGRVFLVLVEVGFSVMDKGHTSFASVREFLKGFEVVGFYEQGGDANFCALDRADALFIHRDLARRTLPVRW